VQRSRRRPGGQQGLHGDAGHRGPARGGAPTHEVRLRRHHLCRRRARADDDLGFFFDNPALEPDVDLFSDEGVYSQATYVEGAGRARGTWVAAFFPDLMAWDKTRASDAFAPGSESLGYCFPNVTSLRMGGHVLASGTYKRAHYHGDGAVIVIPGGEGFSAMWPVPGAGNEETVVVHWHEGSMFGPPNLWYHMHANVGALRRGTSRSTRRGTSSPVTPAARCLTQTSPP